MATKRDVRRTLFKRNEVRQRFGVMEGDDGYLHTISGTLLHITDALAKPLQSFEVALAPKQEGSGDPSPDNVRPISGWTGVDIYRTGENLWGGLKMAQDFEIAYGYSIDTVSKTFTFSRCQSTVAVLFSKFKENTVYTAAISFSNNGNNNCIRFMYTDGTTTAITLGNSSGDKTNARISSASNKSLKAIILGWFTENPTTVYYEESGLFEGSITVADFVPYTGETTPVSWQDEAGTVYGGTLTVNEDGSVVLTGKFTMTDLGSKSWTYSSAYSAFWTTISGIKRPTNNTEVSSFYAEKYEPTYYNSVAATSPTTFNLISGRPTDDRVYCRTDGTSATSPTGQLCYELATPVTYHLDSIPPITLDKGVNNIWNSGDQVMTAEYWGSEQSDPMVLSNLNTILGGRYTNNHTADDLTDEEALRLITEGETR